MSKALVIVDIAYKGPRRTGRGTGKQGLKATLRYLQYRDKRNNHLAQQRGVERWHDRGLGLHHRAIYDSCLKLGSKHVIAWTWVVSPAPDLLALVPERDRPALLNALTERVVEEYYTQRGLDVPEYAYVQHHALTKATQDQPEMEHLHTHVILPGTAPGIAERLPVYNNVSKGHAALLHEIAEKHFAEALDRTLEHDWRYLRPDLKRDAPAPDDFDLWFS